MLLAVHIADGVLEPAWIYAGFLGMALLLIPGLVKPDDRAIPRIGVLTAAFFVASLIHIKLGLISVHLLLNGLIGLILRRYAVVAIAVGLALQAVLFAHGGVSTIGINCCVLGIPAILAGGLFRFGSIWLKPSDNSAVVFGVVLGAFAGVLTVLGHVSVLYFGGKGDWSILAATSFVAHLPIIAIEAAGNGFVVRVLAKAKPHWLGLRHS